MYWRDFPKAAPRPKPKPGKARRKFGETWWGAKWVEILSEFEYGQRMSRGRAYARADMVKNFKVKEGNISAAVKGSSGSYSVNITFDKFSKKKWAAIMQKLNETPIILGNLLNNEMPENISEITGCSFVPESFESECSCPDDANPCKHIASVFYTLADEIDYDPMILFKINGMDKVKLLSKMGMADESEPETGIAQKPIQIKKAGIKKVRKRKTRKKLSGKKGTAKKNEHRKLRG